MTELLTSANLDDRKFAVRAARALRFREFEAALKPLLKDPDEGLRGNTIFAVSELRLEALYPALIENLKTGSPGVRRAAAQRLGTLAYPPAVAPLIAALKDESIAYSAGEALGRLRAKTAAAALLPLLSATEAGPRNGALDGLGWLEEKRAIGPLRSLLKAPEANTRSKAALSLSFMGAQEAVSDLLPLLQDASPLTRAAAAYALGNLGAKTAAPALLRLLKDVETDVLQAALQSLSVLDTKDALPEILKLLDHADVGVANGAADAAKRIGGPLRDSGDEGPASGR